MPIPPSKFPTWPAKSEMLRYKRREKSPRPPSGGKNNYSFVSSSACLLVLWNGIDHMLVLVGSWVLFFTSGGHILKWSLLTFDTHLNIE